MRTRFCSLAFAAAAALIAGCDSGAGDPEAGAVAAGSDAAVELAPVDRSGVTGTVRAEHDDDETEVTLTLEGLAPGAAYQAHIHSGRCAAGGPVAVPLGDVTAEQGGSGRLSRTVRASQLPADEPAFVQVHDAGGEAVACADLPGHDDQDPGLTDRLPPDTGPDPDTAGRPRP